MRSRSGLSEAAQRLGAMLACALAFQAALSRADEPPIPPGSELTLEHAVELALHYHPARQAAESESFAAVERVGEARSAFLPQVYGVGQYLRATDNGIGDTAYLPGLGISRAPSNGRNTNVLSETFDNYTAGLSVFQYLFDFGRTRGLVEERNAQADAERARLQLVELDLIYQVSASYFDLVAAKEIVKVYEQAVTQREEHLKAVKVKAQAGLKPEIDTFTAQAELSRAELHLVDARNAAATAKVALDNAMGLGETAPDYTQPDTLTPRPVTEPMEAYLRRAFDQRPDLKMLEEEARAAGARIQEFRSDYLPTVGAAAGYNLRGQELAPANNFYAGVVITWPLFNGFLTEHQVAESRLHEDAVHHMIEDLRQRVIYQVKRSYLDWQASINRIQQAEQTLEASRVELDLAGKRYESGLGSILELTDAQRRFTEDGAAHVKAQADSAVAKAALDRDSGSLLPRP
ncbi:MAG TPA: TolC family protein [Myxococcota bacterium]|nr:TolC family protein [Myxococcota bacterium]